MTLGTYTVERELGRGGMGAVYTAVHSLLGRRAAVKVLLGELSRDQAAVQRFFNEARAATAIKHPSIVEIYDFGWSPDGAAYIVMELLEGESLATRLARVGRLPLDAALVVARQIATALGAAHRAGIVHRDLKPDNVFLVPDPEVVTGERVKLLDFGIAKLLTDTGGLAKTTTGAIVGTPYYMSPEQCEGSRSVDAKSDLYALGIILFQMISGRLPFEGGGLGGILGAHQFVPAPGLRTVAPDAPAEVEAFVARLLSKAPAERPGSADEVAAILARLGAPTGPNLGIAPSTPLPGPMPGPLPSDRRRRRCRRRCRPARGISAAPRPWPARPRPRRRPPCHRARCHRPRPARRRAAAGCGWPWAPSRWRAPRSPRSCCPAVTRPGRRPPSTPPSRAPPPTPPSSPRSSMVAPSTLAATPSTPRPSRPSTIAAGTPRWPSATTS
jgi:serine/threonine protein kinase